jgi:hypothetical protein
LAAVRIAEEEADRDLVIALVEANALTFEAFLDRCSLLF